jgi:hypothetical protein
MPKCVAFVISLICLIESSYFGESCAAATMPWTNKYAIVDLDE